MFQHIKRLSISTLIVFTALALLVSPAQAQDPTGGIETFDDATLQGWEYSQDVTVEDGVLRVYAGNFAMKTGSWQDITLTLKFKIDQAGEMVVNYYFGDNSHYALVFFPEGILLERHQSGTPSMLAEVPGQAIQAGTWYNLNLTVKQGSHSVYLDDALVISATDNSPLSAGAVMLHSLGGSTVEFDDFSITGESVGGGSAGEGALPAVGDADAPPEGEPAPGQEPVGGEPPAAAEPAAAAPQGAGSTTPSNPDDIMTEFFASQASNLQLTTLAINLILAAITSFILSRVYIHWGTSLSNRRVFAANFMLMTITTTFIILVVRSSVALSLGLVGALSIVRFRAAVKEPEELAYLFFAIGLGIGLGDNQRLITLLTLTVAILILGLMKVFRNTQADVNLHLNIASHSQKVSLEQIMAVLERHCAKIKLLRLDENANMMETSFVIEFKRVSNLTQAKGELQALSDNLQITFLDNKGIW